MTTDLQPELSSDNQLDYRYFADPRHFSTYQAKPKRCDICFQIRPGFADAFFSSPDGRDIQFVCEPDLMAGRLADVGAQVNNGDRLDLAEQIATLHRDWNEAQVNEYLMQRTRELEVCTPSIVTWEDYEWPAHCADYMRFVKEIGQADCDELGREDESGEQFLRRVLEPSYAAGESEADIMATVEELWASMRPDAPFDNSAVTATSFYLFQCLSCGEYLVEWDHEGLERVNLADAEQDLGY